MGTEVGAKVAAVETRDAIARIDGGMNALITLFADASPMTVSHWNVQTGETFSVGHRKRHRDRVQAFEERLFEEDGWHEVPFQESDDAYAMAREFVGDLSSGKGRTALIRALDGAKPFRGFREALRRYPGLRRRYAQRIADEATARLVLFCVAQGLRLADPRFVAASAALESEFRVDELSAPVVATHALSIGKGKA